MNATYKRVAELLDRWEASVALHARYLALDDAAYAKVQDWPKHQRPTKWVVELARTRLQEMRRLLEARERAGDKTFAESLELMSLLTNLLGSDHIERFIPLAARKSNSAVSGTVRRPRLRHVGRQSCAAPRRKIRCGARPKRIGWSIGRRAASAVGPGAVGQGRCHRSRRCGALSGLGPRMAGTRAVDRPAGGPPDRSRDCTHPAGKPGTHRAQGSPARGLIPSPRADAR